MPYVENRRAFGSEGGQQVCDPINGVGLIAALARSVPDIEGALDIDDQQGGRRGEL
jgi:hypothetical protein